MPRDKEVRFELKDRVGALAEEVLAERERQHLKWGEQRHPSGTGGRLRRQDADLHRVTCQSAARRGDVTWSHILLEEVYEALAEEDESALREELVQVAAVCFAWLEDLDRPCGGREDVECSAEP